MQYLAGIALPVIDPWIALGVFAATMLTDAVCVMYTAAVVHRRDLATANWGALTYMLSAFAVISFTSHWFYVVFAALGAWVGTYASMKYLRWRTTRRDAAIDGGALPETQADQLLPSRAPVSLAAVAAEPRIAA
jgi:hypothetical protein